MERSLEQAAADRTVVEAVRARADDQLREARARVRSLGSDFETLVDATHREEMARTEQRLRVQNLTEKAMAELGMEAEALMADFGPDQPVPVLTGPTEPEREQEQEPEQPEPVPYVRDEQQARLRKAERALAVLGRVNPLALEEFDAMQERHAFLAEQLEDLRRTRKDLIDIIADVDARVQEVFAEAYADVERAFERVFARLFPGGEGRLVLTEPGDWLSTGIEVEAALDETNLGRLLEIYEELRANSQLLVITHQKRTMEIADALYGVTMRGDGVSAVISQRLRETESVA